MPDLRQPHPFTGSLRDGDHLVPVTFRAWIDDTGEVRFNFDDIPIAGHVLNMHGASLNARVRPALFMLEASNEAGVSLRTSSFHLGRSGLHWTDGSPEVLRIQGRCQECTITYETAHAQPSPVVRYQLRGFRSDQTLSTDCALGAVKMQGSSERVDSDIVAGTVQVTAPANADLAHWTERAHGLLKHVRSVMSFAAGKALRTPVVEFFSGSKIEVVVRAQSTQSRSAIPVIQHQHLCPIFEIAVRSFFNPPLAARNLFFATEWLGMDTTYNESRLINAMTALENLVESNLDADAKQMMPEKKFKKLSRAIGKQIDEYCHQQFGERGDQVAKEIRVKRNELNRRSLVDKLYLLAKRWNVSLDGISEEQIRSAKNARDRIVHRGRFYEDGEQQGEDLWCHVTIAREIVTRLVLTALGHRDAYVSYVGGNHTRTLN